MSRWVETHRGASAAARYELERQVRRSRPFELSTLEAIEGWAKAPDPILLSRLRAAYAPDPQDPSALAAALRGLLASGPREAARHARRAVGIAEASLPHLRTIPTRQEHQEALYASLRTALLGWASTWRP